jgi:L-aspartate oxidase
MASSSREPLTITTDVLVVGGGMAGAWAASAAAEAGAKTLVDKGYCGTSGVTAAAGPGHWWVQPDPPEARAIVVRNRLAAGLGLGEGEWMHRILDQTWRALPKLAPHYKFGVDDAFRPHFDRRQQVASAMRAVAAGPRRTS